VLRSPPAGGEALRPAAANGDGSAEERTVAGAAGVRSRPGPGEVRQPGAGAGAAPAAAPGTEWGAGQAAGALPAAGEATGAPGHDWVGCSECA